MQHAHESSPLSVNAAISPPSERGGHFFSSGPNRMLPGECPDVHVGRLGIQFAAIAHDVVEEHIVDAVGLARPLDDDAAQDRASRRSG